MSKIKYNPDLSKASLLFALLFIVGHSAFTQVPFDKALKLGKDSGIKNDWVTTVEEDENGIAWLGTIEGLYSWDGITVESYLPDDEDPYSINSLHIVDVMPDVKNHKVWVASNAGLSVYNTITKRFTNFNDDPLLECTIPERAVRRIFKDKYGDIWVGLSRAGMLKYIPEENCFEQHLCLPSSIDTIDGLCYNSAVDMQDDLFNDSIMWVGTRRGMIKFNRYSGEYQNFRFEHEDKQLRSQYNNMRFITPHPNGKIYYAIWWYGMCSFDTRTHEFERIEPEYVNGSSAFGRDLINSFYHPNDDQIWINSNKGMQLYDIASDRIVDERLNTENNWYSIDHIDGEGRIWSATHNFGLYIFNPLLQQYEVSYYENYSVNYPCYTRQIIEDKENNKLYVASEYSKGLYIMDTETRSWECIQPPEDFNLNQMGGFHACDLIELEEDRLLVVEGSSLFYYEPGFERLKRFKYQPDKGLANLGKAIKDGFGNIWITSANGTVYKLDTEKDQFYNYKNEVSEAAPGPQGFLYLDADQDGNIWMQGKHGLLIYDRDNDKFIFHEYASFNGDVTWIEQISSAPDGRVWIGTNDKKLGYGHKDSLDRGIIKLLGREDGLKGKQIFIASPYKDKLLVFSEQHIQVLTPETLEFEMNIDKNYLPKRTVSFDPIISDSFLILGTIRGIAYVNYDNLKLNSIAPSPYIVSMHAFDELIPVSYSPGKVDSIFLSYKQNFFSFEFSAVNYNLPELTRFEYMLEGYDNEWQDGTERKFASYTKVPGGEYRFLVRAYNNEGVISSEPSITYLNISTIWWKTSWFITMMSLVLIAIAVFLYKLRVSQIRRDEQLKREYERKLADVELSALRAQMNPHFIFNSLNSIEYYIISNEPAKASDYLNRFSRLIRLILQNSKNTIVPLKDDIEALKLYIELESMRFEKLFDYEVKLEKGIDIEKISVPPMLLQPYVENAIWHGLLQKKDEQGKIEITIRMENNCLKCTVEDNGIGRKAAENLKSKTATKKKSYGMKITSDRLQMLNKLAGTKASVDVIDLYDSDGMAQGTRVELVIPI